MINYRVMFNTEGSMKQRSKQNYKRSYHKYCRQNTKVEKCTTRQRRTKLDIEYNLYAQL